MKFRTINQNQRLYTLLQRHKITPEQKQDLVYNYTSQRTIKSSEMSVDECAALIKWLEEYDGTDAPKEAESSDRMRKKILSCCHQMGWYLREENSRETGPGRLILKNGKPQLDYDHINSFCQVKSPHKKALMLHNYKELTELVTVFENVLKTTIKKAA